MCFYSLNLAHCIHCHQLSVNFEALIFSQELRFFFFFLAFQGIILSNHTLASGLLHFLFPLPGVLSPQSVTWLAPSCHLGTRSDITSSEKPSPACLKKPHTAVSYHSLLCFPSCFSLTKFVIMYLFICLPHYCLGLPFISRWAPQGHEVACLKYHMTLLIWWI